MSGQDAMQSLVALGLTSLEAEIYSFLVRESPATGYGVGKGLGKPAPNVYKALETLLAKGAVVIDDGATRYYRAVPVEELLQRMERDFRRHCQTAVTALQPPPTTDFDTRIYQICEGLPLLERARSMIDGARQILLVDVFPGLLEKIRPALESAAARRVIVAVKCYGPAEVAGAHVHLEPEAKRVRRRWPAQWLNLVADGSQVLISLMDDTGSRVHQAVWSESPYLAWIIHAYFAHELQMTALKTEFSRGRNAKALRLTMNRTETYHALDAPVYLRLLRQLGVQEPESDHSKEEP